MERSRIVYAGLDLHKNSIGIATADSGRDGEVRHVGTVGGGWQDRVGRCAPALAHAALPSSAAPRSIARPIRPYLSARQCVSGVAMNALRLSW